MAAIQGARGTLIVVVITPSALYAAVDSRVLSDVGTATDHAEKLILLDDHSLCALSGYVRFVRSVSTGQALETFDTPLDLAMFAGNVASKLGARNPTLHGYALAKSLYQGLLPIWSAFASNLTSDFGARSSNPRPLASLIHVTRHCAGKVRITRIDLAHSLGLDSSGQYSSELHPPAVDVVFDSRVVEPVLFLFGCKKVGPSKILTPTPGDASAIALITKCFDESINAPECVGRIGGPIDIASLSDDGCRWLQHKSTRESDRS